MSFDGVERDEKFFGNLLVGQALGDQLQHFVVPLADAQPLQFRFVELEVQVGNDDFSAREPQARPNVKPREEHGHNTEIKLKGKIIDEEAVFDGLQQSG